MDVRNINNFSIFGSGFGLYGYVPALIKEGVKNIHLTKKGYEAFLKRPELAKYKSHINYHLDQKDLLETSEGIVVALPPHAQEDLVNKILDIQDHKVLLLEKPLCPTARSSAEMMKRICDHKISFRIGYIFRYQAWVSFIKDYLDSEKSDETECLEIKWCFHAHHKKNNIETWKDDPKQGGGIISFYLIHLIALMAEFGLGFIEESPLKRDLGPSQNKITLGFAGEGQKRINVHIDICSDVSEFSLYLVNQKTGEQEKLFDSHSPFTASKVNCDDDDRISSLQEHIASLKYNDESFYEWYDKTHDMWHIIDKKFQPHLK